MRIFAPICFVSCFYFGPLLAARFAKLRIVRTDRYKRDVLRQGRSSGSHLALIDAQYAALPAS
jgi:hypothetical protein